MLQDYLGEFLDKELKFKKEFISSLDKNPYILYYLADKSIRLYTRFFPKLVYFAINALFAKLYQTKYP